MAKEAVSAKAGSDSKPVCGVIMPISAMPPKYDAAHWSDVRKVLDAAIVDAGMIPQIVSDSFESDVIQNRIIHNLYDNEMVVCDVSGLNANVMFELGMRLTFNKPVVIVTDDFANIPFDTKIIEHLGYPTDLHIHKTVDLQKQLTAKISQIGESKKAGRYKSPLEAFGSFQVFQPTTESVPGDKYVAERMDELFSMVARLERRMASGLHQPSALQRRNALSDFPLSQSIKIILNGIPPEETLKKVMFLPNVESMTTGRSGNNTTVEVGLMNNDARALASTLKEISLIVGPDAVIEKVNIS